MLLSRRQIASNMAERLLAGQSSQNIIRQLAAYLIETKQTNYIEQYISDIEYELEKRDLTVVDITTSGREDSEISGALRSKITDFVKSQNQNIGSTLPSSSLKRKIILREHIDRSILGGVVISTPSKRLDASLSTRLKLLEEL
jgi:F-type H+-transporting ATPase subunit delta